MKRISCIIPNYNGEKTIEYCINSIIKSDKNNLITEIIVVDDGSTDNSVRIIKNRYPFIKLIENRKNKGASYSRNVGIKKSRTNHILFIDNDIRIEKNFFQRISKNLNKYDILYPKIIFEDGSVMMPKSDEEKKFPKVSSVFLVNRNALKKLDELFDETYLVYDEDTDFFLRCFVFGLKAKYVENATAIHKIKPQATHDKRYYLELRNKIYSLIKLSPIPKKAKKAFHFPNFKSIVILLLMGITNKDIFEEKIIKLYYDFFKILFKSKKKIAKSRFRLLCLSLSAISWNIINIKRTTNKRKKLKTFLNKYCFLQTKNG